MPELEEEEKKKFLDWFEAQYGWTLARAVEQGLYGEINETHRYYIEWIGQGKPTGAIPPAAVPEPSFPVEQLREAGLSPQQIDYLRGMPREEAALLFPYLKRMPEEERAEGAFYPTMVDVVADFLMTTPGWERFTKEQIKSIYGSASEEWQKEVQQTMLKYKPEAAGEAYLTGEFPGKARFPEQVTLSDGTQVKLTEADWGLVVTQPIATGELLDIYIPSIPPSFMTNENVASLMYSAVAVNKTTGERVELDNTQIMSLFPDAGQFVYAADYLSLANLVRKSLGLSEMEIEENPALDAVLKALAYDFTAGTPRPDTEITKMARDIVSDIPTLTQLRNWGLTRSELELTGVSQTQYNKLVNYLGQWGKRRAAGGDESGWQYNFAKELAGIDINLATKWISTLPEEAQVELFPDVIGRKFQAGGRGAPTMYGVEQFLTDPTGIGRAEAFARTTRMAESYVQAQGIKPGSIGYTKAVGEFVAKQHPPTAERKKRRGGKSESEKRREEEAERKFEELKSRALNAAGRPQKVAFY